MGALARRRRVWLLPSGVLLASTLAHRRGKQPCVLGDCSTAAAAALMPGPGQLPPALALDARRRPVFIVGNEAADLDSLVSAYTLAALLDSQEVQGVAVAQIPRGEFRLRGDALSLFRVAGSPLLEDGSPAHLRFWDDVDWEAVKQIESRQVVLTDHNKMTDSVAEVFGGRVQLILDHHAASGAHAEATAIIDEALGSACTLVAERYLEQSPELPPEMGRLLAGVVLLDTRNFDPQKNKFTVRDVRSFASLARYIPEKVGQKGWYKALQQARKEVSHLRVEDLLVLDMKAARIQGFEEGQVAFSAMMTSLEATLEKAGGAQQLLEAMQGHASARGFRAVVCSFPRNRRGSKALACAPARGRDPDVCHAIEARLTGAPGNLPRELRENDLFAAQGILEQGFGLAALEGLAPLRAFTMRPEITRKTLLPRATSAATPASAL